MAGKIAIPKDSQPFQRHLNNRLGTGLLEDGWKQTLGKIMFGDDLTWCAITSLPYRRNRNREYIVERIPSQPRLLQILRDLPVCTGVGVRRDVEEIKDFYTMISGESVKLNGFLDLSGMEAAAGYKLRARNMTTLGVQVLGTVLNKNFSKGDDLWGPPWAELPSSLQVYGIGNISFGYICYSILAGIMIRDLFPGLEIV